MNLHKLFSLSIRGVDVSLYGEKYKDMDGTLRKTPILQMKYFDEEFGILRIQQYTSCKVLDLVMDLINPSLFRQYVGKEYDRLSEFMKTCHRSDRFIEEIIRWHQPISLIELSRFSIQTNNINTNHLPIALQHYCKIVDYNENDEMDSP